MTPLDLHYRSFQQAPCYTLQSIHKTATIHYSQSICPRLPVVSILSHSRLTRQSNIDCRYLQSSLTVAHLDSYKFIIPLFRNLTTDIITSTVVLISNSTTSPHTKKHTTSPLIEYPPYNNWYMLTAQALGIN